jgi:putative oxidoreductase
MNSLSAWAPRALSVLRIIIGLMFFEHGLQKIAGFPPGHYANTGVHMSLEGLSGCFEISAILVAIGLFTRPVAFILSGMMAVGYWTTHFPQNPWPVNNMGDAAILYCFIFLYFVFAGPGPWSIDARMKTG